MITNDQMKANRYGRWADARKLVNEIQSVLSEGGYVVMATYLKAWQYDQRHVGMFKATKSGAYVLRGKKWECIDYCGIRFARPRTAVETDLMHEYRDF
jgi:hypothetical protein